MIGDPLEPLVMQARSGDRAALETLVRTLEPKIYALAVRMLSDRENAADATQDILVRIVTRLGSFRGDSRFMTWVYRIAANHLLTVRASRIEAAGYTFERFAAELEDGSSELADDEEWPADRALLLEEVKVGCMLGMLTCLDRDHRLAYVLGEILELDGPEAAAVLSITPAAFRKRLSRARAALVDFTRRHCGLMEARNRCRCARRLPEAQRLGRVQPDMLQFADAVRAREFGAALEQVRRLDAQRRLATLYRTHSEPRAPDLVARIDAIFNQPQS